MMKRIGLGLAALWALGALAACATAPAETPGEDWQIWLVRHAEKQSGDDPSLTPQGALRAEALADLLDDADIARIHSSDFRRTRETARPLAERLGVEVELYDPRDLPGLAARLRAEGGRHLVVGHSNTTPQLTEALGGDGGTPIVEATEYDRLYLVSPDGETVLLRYGERSPR
jgi:phosphohistidine phosphatase SixA